MNTPSKEYRRQWRNKNKAKVNEQARQWRLRNVLNEERKYMRVETLKNILHLLNHAPLTCQEAIVWIQTVQEINAEIAAQSPPPPPNPNAFLGGGP